MTQPLMLSLRPEARFAEVSDHRVVLEAPQVRLPLDDLAPGLLSALKRLASGGAPEDTLADLVLRIDGATALARLYYLLGRLQRLCLINYSLAAGDEMLTVVTPMSGHFQLHPTPPSADTRVQLSRFAYCRRENDHLVLESPCSGFRVTVLGAIGGALISALARPQAPHHLSTLVGVTEETAKAFTRLLLDTGMVGEICEDDTLPEDANVRLRQWDFHDLLFHARCRAGRHDYPFGSTFRFLGTIAPLPAVKRPMVADTIPLARPDLDLREGHDARLGEVLETRRSIREYGKHPIGLDQLSEFLYRVASVRQRIGADSELGRHYEVSQRPYPSGGAAYDLELYLTINACEGLAPGLYHYDPGAHQLEKLSGPNARTEALLRDACWSGELRCEPQVLITLTSRFQRLSWKYQSIAYATTLKNVGVLYQTMYLVATAMGLAPCALGGGDADLSAQAMGTDYYAESSVGEFLLGSRKRT